MLRAKNKETGAGLTDKQVVAQSNSFMIAGKLPEYHSLGRLQLPDADMSWSAGL